jgi:hypothetical protein
MQLARTIAGDESENSHFLGHLEMRISNTESCDVIPFSVAVSGIIIPHSYRVLSFLHTLLAEMTVNANPQSRRL